MNITIINAQDNLIKVKAVGDRLIEYYAHPDKKNFLDLKVYDPVLNSVSKIAPQKKILSFVDVINCIWNSTEFYFAACELTREDELQIGIYKYSFSEQSYEKTGAVFKDPKILNGQNRIKIFILSESAILVQTEILHNTVSENMIGNIEFLITLLRLDTGEENTVTDSNFLNNGINLIKAVSDNKIMVKTGYSWIEDSRMTDSADSGAFIEGVYVTTTSKFIADLTLAADSIDMPLIDSAYRDRHIICTQVTGSYTHYIIRDAQGMGAKCVFYNNETGERLEYNAGLLDINDLRLTYVINNQPYIRNTLKHEINFLNLKKAEMDISFYDEKFIDQTGDIFILEEEGKKDSIHIYTYPGLALCYSDTREFYDACRIGDNYYIYCQ